MGGVIIGKGQLAANAYASLQTDGEIERGASSGPAAMLELTVNKDNRALNAAGVNTDGYDTAFALVPTKDGGWKRVDLHYDDSVFEGNRGGGGETIDEMHAYVNVGSDSDISIDRLESEGVAFGLDCPVNHNDPSSPVTTVWLQNANDNYKPYNE